MRRRFGALLLASLGGILAFSPAPAQISPGELARAHAELEGPRNCMTCHGDKAGAMNGKCLDCHRDIALLRERDRGLHAGAASRPCAACHPEHAGRDFELIEWKAGSPDRFDHSEAGWTLAGKHAAAACRACHQPAHQSAEIMDLSKRRNRAASWVGLETRCASCHEDAHRGALDADCARCHGSDAWKPAAAFDHAKSAFPLTGKHAGVACARCHPADGGAATAASLVYRPVAHAQCDACHRDPHAGRLGGACATCHVASSFREIVGAAFDHGATRFPLRGKHADVECARCHDPVKAWGKRPAFDRCAACHADPHAEETAPAAPAADCAACHDERAFRPSTFTIARHADTRYPLEGRHREVPCRRCHAGEAAAGGGTMRRPAAGRPTAAAPARIPLHPAFARCRDCHEDAHAGQLAHRADGGACESCHGTEGWKPSRFALADHRALGFPLEGRHAALACAGCHGPARAQLPPLPPASVIGRAGVLFDADAEACRTCHQDPHEGRFAATASGLDAAACLTCHGDAAFAPAAIDPGRHRTLGFPLDGAHAAVPCLDCHRALDRPHAASTLILSPRVPALPFTERRDTCDACHRDPHAGQFASRPGGGVCDRCHGVETFAPAARFDHGRDAGFSLKGAHAAVSCARCHPIGTTASGPVVRYTGTPRACDRCHGRTSRDGDPSVRPRGESGRGPGNRDSRGSS